MGKPVSLDEFVRAFSIYEEKVSADSWILKDLGLDADELDWGLRDFTARYGWQYSWEANLTKYLPFEAWPWTKRDSFADLKLRELYAYSRVTKAR